MSEPLSEPLHEEWTDLLSGYLDNELDLATRRRLEAHLASCAGCARIHQELAAMVAVAPTYHGREPATDLWPGIARGIDTGRMIALAGPRPIRRRWTGLIAAGLAAAAIGAGLLWSRQGGARVPGSTPGGTQAPIVAATPASIVFESQAYDSAVAELQKTLVDRRGALDTATVRIVEESLAAIDRAIAEARSAIQRDTANAYLNDQIAGNLRKKLNVLRLATRAIASET